jgi:ABC-2 type transport system permease protein
VHASQLEPRTALRQPLAAEARLFLHEFRTEQLLFWRNREAAFFTFLLPVIFFLIFGSVYGNDRIALTTSDHVRGAAFLEAGMIGYGVAATCFAGLGITLVVRRESGVLKRIRATPLPAMTYLVAMLASTFLVFLIEAVIIVCLGRLLFSVAVPDRLFSLAGVLALGSLTFAALGLGVTGLVRSAEGSSAVINAIYLPMAIVSGTFYSPHSYPAFLRVIADVLPLTHFTELTRDVMLRHDHIWTDWGAIGVVVLWGLIGLAGAARGFRWQPREA